MTFACQSACGPYALKRLLNKSYDSVCKQIESLGGNYEKVTPDVMHSVLQQTSKILKFFVYKRNPFFSEWRQHKIKGQWVVFVTSKFYNEIKGRQTGHCIILDNGHAKDNGWIMEWIGESGIDDIEVMVYWQIEQNQQLTLTH